MAGGAFSLKQEGMGLFKGEHSDPCLKSQIKPMWLAEGAVPGGVPSWSVLGKGSGC